MHGRRGLLAAVMVSALAGGGCFGHRHERAGKIGPAARIAQWQYIGLASIGAAGMCPVVGAMASGLSEAETVQAMGTLLGVGVALLLAAESVDATCAPMEGRYPQAVRRCQVAIAPTGVGLACRF